MPRIRRDEPPPPNTVASWRAWVPYVLAWVVAIVLFTAQDAYTARAGGPQGLHSILTRQILNWTAWALLVPVVVVLSRRFPVRGVDAGRNVVVHTVLGAIAAIVHSALVAAVYPLFYYRPSLLALRDVFRDRIYATFGIDLLTYAALAAAAHGFAYARAARERELARSRLAARDAAAELEFLRRQLQPHFLFNALNTVAGLVESDPATARRVTEGLSQLLRVAVRHGSSDLVSLESEVALLEAYAAIQEARFGDRIRFRLACEPAARNALVPTMLIQPLVENAIHHGLSPRAAGGRIDVTIRREGDSVRIDVEDDGVGPDPRGTAENIGLGSMRRRLELLFGEDYSLSLDSRNGGGAHARVVLPFRPAPR